MSHLPNSGLDVFLNACGQSTSDREKQKELRPRIGGAKQCSATSAEGLLRDVNFTEVASAGLCRPFELSDPKQLEASRHSGAS